MGCAEELLNRYRANAGGFPAQCNKPEGRPSCEQLRNRSDHVFCLHQHRSTSDALCVPQKNGNRAWGLLAWRSRMLHNSLPLLSPRRAAITHAGMPRSVRGIVKRVQMVDCRSLRTSGFRFMLVRSPYVRLLSGYLDKIAKDRNTTVCTPASPNASVETFAHFVDRLYRHRRSSATFNKHWRPQWAFCGAICCPDLIVLREEEQHDWFRCFLQMTGSQHAAESGWERFVGQASMLDAIESGASGRNRKFHQSSSSRIHEFYTPEIAQKVTTLFKEDLRLFGYKEYGGGGEFKAIE